MVGWLVFAALIGVIFLGEWSWRRRTRREVREWLLRELGTAPAKLDDKVPTFGVSSRGLQQARSNGCLAVTETELAYAQWVPRRILRVALSDITAVGTTHEHLHTPSKVPLLHVAWEEGGEEDSIALQVEQPSAWIALLPEPTES